VLRDSDTMWQARSLQGCGFMTAKPLVEGMLCLANSMQLPRSNMTPTSFATVTVYERVRCVNAYGFALQQVKYLSCFQPWQCMKKNMTVYMHFKSKDPAC